VNLRVTRSDTTAQAIMGVAEGGDGIHEYPIVDTRLSAEGAEARGDAELDAFAEPLVEAEWVTQDLSARPGRSQVITLTGPDVLSTTLTILSVEVTFHTPRERPLRACIAGTVKPAGFLDAVTVES